MSRKGWNGYREERAFCPATGKACYDKRGAITAANLRFREDHQVLRPYSCATCGAWHLTKQIVRDREFMKRRFYRKHH